MRFSLALALASVPAAVLGATQVVTVGANNMLMFDPQNITAAQGDMVEFQFASKNHSVTQSTFPAPCTKAPTAINSGFLATPANSTATNGSMPTWTIQIQNASTPLWFYCAQKMPVVHCAMGMVFSINASPDKNTFDEFQAAAKATANSTASAAGGAAADAASPNATSTGASGGAANAPGASSADSSAPASGTQDSSNAAASTAAANGASKTVLKRGAAGLLTVAAVGAMLL